MPSLHVGPLPGNPLAASLPVQATRRGRDRRLLPELYVVVQLQGGKGQKGQGGVTQSAGEMVGGEAKTHLVFRRVRFLHVALVRFAVGELPQLVRRLLVQLAADLFALPAVGEVVRREPAVVEAVDVGAEAEQTADQRRVLEVHRQVKRCPTAALFLQTRRLALAGSGRFHATKAKAADGGVYLRVDIGAEANEAFHQRNVAVNGCQVETVVSWSEKK